MKAKILITLCFAISLCVEVYGEADLEVKRGVYPFVAFIYYPDETIVDGSGARFLRGAVIIRPDWLVSSAIDIVAGEPTGFPRKTLIARAGAITIDKKFTLNEDEDEQEREIIQIVRPFNHSATQWWHTDISLMKTLEPFKQTPVVVATSLINRLENTDKPCTILVYAKRNGNATDDRFLMQLTVELLQAPSSVESCGHHFVESTMICAADSDENKNVVYDPNFCQGNSGGPLICDNDVVGLQTYIDNYCRTPHLYQLLSAWENFISCGTEEKCHEEECSKICDITSKDPSLDLRTAPTVDMSTEKTQQTTINTATGEAIDTTTFDTSSVDGDSNTMTPTVTIPEQNATKLTSADVTSDEQTPEIPQTAAERRSIDETSSEYVSSTKEETTQQKWPNEKHTDGRKSMEQNDIDENKERQAKVEAQHHHELVQDVRSMGLTNLFSQSFLFGYIILAFNIIV